LFLLLKENRTKWSRYKSARTTNYTYAPNSRYLPSVRKEQLPVNKATIPLRQPSCDGADTGL